jgi:4-hydroxybenzoate polyprenyltransferase
MACVGGSFGLLWAIGLATSSGWVMAPLGAVMCGVCLLRVQAYRKSPTAKAQDDMDTIAGLWVFTCYAMAGFVPLIMRAL